MCVAELGVRLILSYFLFMITDILLAQVGFRKRGSRARSERECLDPLFACGVDRADVQDRGSCSGLYGRRRRRNGGDGHTGRALGRGEQSLLQPPCHLHPDPGGHIWSVFSQASSAYLFTDP